MYKYAIVILAGDTEVVVAHLNRLAAEGYRIAHVVHPSTATSPCTFFKPQVIMEKFEPAAPVALPLPSEGRTV